MNRPAGESERPPRRLRAAVWLLLASGAALVHIQAQGQAETPAQAPRPSAVGWTPDTVRLVKEGDPRRGRELAADCASCHGPTGVAPTRNFPSLAGQRAEYVYKQLRDYKDGVRQHPIMTALAGTLADGEMADLAAWYAEQALPEATQTAGLRLPGVGTARAQDNVPEAAWRLVRFGDSKRHLAPCMVCHGAAGEGASIGVPALAGQTEPYLRQTMLQFKHGERANDTYARMRLIAQELSDEEIAGLAAYYAQRPAR